MTLAPGRRNSLLDQDRSALIITERRDDYVTDPDGNSGVAVAGGVIRRSVILSELGSGFPTLVTLLSIASMAPFGLLVYRRLRRSPQTC